MTAKERIPNFDTLSTLIDRLSIENVKLAHFQNELEHDAPDEDVRVQLAAKIDTQQRIIERLKEEVVQFLEETYLSGEYSYMTEERTFT